MKQDRTPGSILFDVVNYLILTVVVITMVIPFIHIIGTSFAHHGEIVQSVLLLVPKNPTLDAYRYVLSSNTTLLAMRNSLIITFGATAIAITLTVLTAYVLADKNLFMRRYILLAVIFTMLFSPGLIPHYLTFRSYGLLDTFGAVMLPKAINVFYLLLMKNFFQDIPAELKEAARIDGCNDLSILYKIVLPLSKPAIATFLLFYAVDNWNSYFDAMLYLDDATHWPITVVLRQVIMMASSVGSADVAAQTMVSPTAVRMATIVLSVAPILASYPFLQKYFQSGIMVGSIKG